MFPVDVLLREIISVCAKGKPQTISAAGPAESVPKPFNAALIY
jgi:hypothetical protein